MERVSDRVLVRSSPELGVARRLELIDEYRACLSEIEFTAEEDQELLATIQAGRTSGFHLIMEQMFAIMAADDLEHLVVLRDGFKEH